jgi:hypothetical protein
MSKVDQVNLTCYSHRKANTSVATIKKGCYVGLISVFLKGNMDNSVALLSSFALA